MAAAAVATLPPSSSASPAAPTFRHQNRFRSRPSKAPIPPPPPLAFLCTRKSSAASLLSPPPTSFSKSESPVLLSPATSARRRRSRGKRRHFELFTGQDGAISGWCRRLLHIAVQLGDPELARAVHSFVAKNLCREEREDGGEEGVVVVAREGGEEEILLMNTLISTYLKLSRLSEARQLFEEMHHRDVISFTCMISAYAKCGEEDEALDLFSRMRHSGVEPNAFSYVAVLTSCIRQPNSWLGMQLHGLVLKSPHCGNNVHVSNALMAFYIGCGHLNDAVALFEEMVDRDVTSWNTIISGMVKDGRYHRALELFQEMRMDGFSGDSFTMSTLLTAVAEGFSLAHGEMVHAHALKIGLELNLSVGNSLISFYTQFGSVENVSSVFDRMPRRDIISWNGMIRSYMMFGCVESAVEVFDFMPLRNGVSYNVLLAGFCQNNEGYRALELFKSMVGEDIEMSNFVLTSVINACAIVGEVSKSEQIQAFVLKAGCGSDGWIRAALLDMCTKCNRLEDAQRMFQQWDDDESHAIAWTSLICGYARNGQPNEAITLFNAMQREREFVTMDEVTLTTVLGVCGFLGFNAMGKQIHGYAHKSMNLFDLQVGNAIFSMYSKCGEMEDALKYFSQMPEYDLVSWNILITAYLLHQRGDEALSVWEQMKDNDLKPDHITFLLILSACKFTTLDSVAICQNLLSSMTSCYGIKPASEHYASVVNVLGHWGHFKEAEEVIRSMPFKPDASTWRALLETSRSHSNLNLGKEAARQILALEPNDPSTYVLISNLYAASGRWTCSEMVRKEMKRKGLRKHPAQSWIIHRNMVHSFFTRDRAHPGSKDIYSALDILILECMKAGYVPDNSFVLHEVEEFQKRDFLFYHSAKLAVTYGHLVTDRWKPVRVVKNIRLCGDCHAFMKCLSAVLDREISLRDSTGFHRFKSGKCSCNDCW